MTRREEFRSRLGAYGVMSGSELDELAVGETLAAVVYAVWRWKGWIAAATSRRRATSPVSA